MLQRRSRTTTISSTDESTVTVSAPPAAAFADALEANVPNPFNPNPTTVIRYHLARAQRVSLTVHDAHGAVVRRLVDGAVRESGAHTATWDGRDAHGDAAASGVYFYRLRGSEFAASRRMVLVR